MQIKITHKDGVENLDGCKKIQIIKIVREHAECGLKDAKDVVDFLLLHPGIELTLAGCVTLKVTEYIKIGTVVQNDKTGLYGLVWKDNGPDVEVVAIHHTLPKEAWICSDIQIISAPGGTMAVNLRKFTEDVIYNHLHRWG